jgi:hypothetical protein
MWPKGFMTFYMDESGKIEKLKTQFYDPIYFENVGEGKGK